MKVLTRAKESRSSLKILENQIGGMFSHLKGHDDFINNLIKGKFKGDRGQGQPGVSYYDHIKTWH